MRRPVIAALVAIVVAGVVAAVLHVTSHTDTPTVQLTAADVRVTKCEYDLLLTGSADVVNPTHSRANLVFALEFDWGDQNVGLLDYIATNVAAGKQALVSNMGSSNILFTEKLLARRPRLTCSVVKFGDGGIVPRRT